VAKWPLCPPLYDHGPLALHDYVKHYCLVPHPMAVPLAADACKTNLNLDLNLNLNLNLCSK
jgi:hypothetical protein